MSFPKNRSVSVSKGLMAVADVKLNSPTQTNSQSVIVNVKDRDVEVGKPYEDEDGITIVPVKEPTYPEVNRDLSSVADIRNASTAIRRPGN